MIVNKLTMNISDPVLDAKSKKTQYDRSHRIWPIFIGYLAFFTVINSYNLFIGKENALYFVIRNLILQSVTVTAYFISKRWSFVIGYMSVIVFCIIAISNVHTLYSPTFYKTEKEREHHAITALAGLNVSTLI
jgi:hypothetical protein